MNEMISPENIRKALNILKPNGELFEIRILAKPKKTLSGYFKNIDLAIEELEKQNLRNANVFWTLNVINDGCYDRNQHDKFEVPENTTQDKEIMGYKWLLVDLDPVRVTGTSSTDKQLNLAKSKARTVSAYLKRQGFEEPVVAMSGNGYHLLYRVQMKKDRESTVEGFLKALDLMFSDDDIKIDTANYNPARICKLYGTLAQKGTGLTKGHIGCHTFAVCRKRYGSHQLPTSRKSLIPYRRRKNRNRITIITRRSLISGTGCQNMV